MENKVIGVVVYDFIKKEHQDYILRSDEKLEDIVDSIEKDEFQKLVRFIYR